ncbi:MAG: V-type ATP synthase subunit D [Bacteroidota bacterium]
MALKFNYNKTTIQSFKKQLSIREKALPILKNKETALRQEVKSLAKAIEKLEEERTEIDKDLEQFKPFWKEFPNVLSLGGLNTFQKKIIGVKVREVDTIKFKIADISWWNLSPWIPLGIKMLKKKIALDLQIEIRKEQLEKLQSARKKTTQKVNLYEKVQIPEYSSAILKIKRFLEDKENISKAGQKIMKRKQELKEVA